MFLTLKHKVFLAFGTFIVCFLLVILIKHPSDYKEKYPDLELSITELIESRGFKHETHFITSKDGYILQVVRIVNPNYDEKKSKNLKPVILHHFYPASGSVWLVAANGSLSSNGTYVETDPEGQNQQKVGNSLGFVLAATGSHEVWLANSRGNPYSSNHTSLSIESDAFWNFNLDTIIRYDLPAVIDYIRNVTKREKIAYIGHSQGTSMMYGLLASQPRFNDIIAPFISLSPEAFFSKVKVPIDFIDGQSARIRSLFPRDIFTYWFRRFGVARACTNPILKETVCFWGYYFLTGSPRSQIDFNRLPVYLDNFLAGSSTENLKQLLQQRSNLAYFDYRNTTENIAHYGKSVPPIYDYGRITSKELAIFYLLKDWYLHLDNIELLRKSLKVPFRFEYAIPDESWNHWDLIWGRDVGKEVNSRVLKLLKNY